MCGSELYMVQVRKILLQNRAKNKSNLKELKDILAMS